MGVDVSCCVDAAAVLVCVQDRDDVDVHVVDVGARLSCCVMSCIC